MNPPGFLSALSGRPARWSRVRGERRHWDLVVDGRSGPPVASLRWPKVFRSIGLAEAAGESWEFRTTGFFGRHVALRRPGGDRDIGVLKRRWTRGGVLEVPGRRRFEWTKAGVFRARWTFRAEDGTAVVTFRRVGVFRPSAEVEVHHSAARYDQLPLLLTLGWYLILLEAHETAAAAARG